MIFETLKDLHAVLKPFDNICPRKCLLCEHHETAILLPGEEELLSFRPGLIKQFYKHEEGFYYLDLNTQCPYFSFDDGIGECAIYSDRPIDCRIFPFYPRFNIEDNSYSLMKSSGYCLILSNDLSQMEEEVRKVLDVVNRYASRKWKAKYNELNDKQIRQSVSQAGDAGPRAVDLLLKCNLI